MPIPDLSGAAVRISRHEGSPALAEFIRGLITEEFDGPEPAALTLDAITAYVRSLDSSACPEVREQPVRVATYAQRAQQAVQAALYAWNVGDTNTARLMLGSARGELGAIDERYARAELAADRVRLRVADGELALIQKTMDQNGRDVPIRITVWLARAHGWVRPLIEHEGQSRFSPERPGEKQEADFLRP